MPHNLLHITWGLAILGLLKLERASLVALVFGGFYTALAIGGVLLHDPFGLDEKGPPSPAQAFWQRLSLYSLRPADQHLVKFLLLLPLAVPLLIFAIADALLLEAAVSLLLTAGAPFVAGAAIRAGRT